MPVEVDTLQPCVLEGYTLLQFMHHILNAKLATSWLIVCSTREAFMTRLDASLKETPPSTEEQANNEVDFAVEYLQRALSTRLTMRLLASCGTMRVAFAPDVARLRAFLASLTTTTNAAAEIERDQLSTPAPRTTIAILDPIQVHKPTVSYSAQGFNRTFALAVEAACVQKSVLILCEIHHDLNQTAEDSMLLDVVHDASTDGSASIFNPWDADIGIVDVRTKTFGPGSRGWAGRTVKIRQVAARWMSFKTPKA